MRDVLERIHSRYPDDFKIWWSCDGSGVDIREELFTQFQQAFIQTVTEWLKEEQLQRYYLD